MRSRLCFALSIGLFGCNQPSIYALQGGGDSTGDDGPYPGNGGGGSGNGGNGGAACTTNEIALELTIADGVVDSQVVPINYDGVDGYLAIDTGSPLTFVFGKAGDPDYIEHVGDAALGCETVPLALLTLDAIDGETFNGKPILGILGIDFFSDRPAEIDYPGARVVRYVTSEPDTEGLVSVASELTGERVLMQGALDGADLTLIYDAGSPHTLWVGVAGEKRDEEVMLGTADGGTALVYEGTAELLLGSDPARTITVWRTPEFPYIQEELDELGADGLLGASGMGFRRILFDSAAGAVWLGPLSTP